jgi:CHASE2 domain-containing sensor protein
MTDFSGRPLFLLSSKERWAEIYIRFSPLKTLEDQTILYHSLRDAAEDSPLWQRFQGKLVLIGNTVTPDDEHSISPMEKRCGIYILADGINTLLQARYIQHAQTSYHIIILLVMSSMGTWLRWRISPRRTALGKGWLVAVSLLYLAAAILLYTEFLRLVKITYHLVALVLTYWSVGLLRKNFV